MALPTYAMNQAGFPEMYERELVGPLFRPWVEPLLEAAALSDGDSLLDVACGTGIVGRLAAERTGGRVVGVDISADMLAVARAVAPGVDWREGDAVDLPLREGEMFDVVTCQQGLQFFADKVAAAAQMRRALAPGGRVAISTWLPDEPDSLFGALRRVGERQLGPIDDRRFSLGSGERLEALLRDAGFADVRSRIVTRTLRFADGAPFVRLNAMALVGMSRNGMDLGKEDRSRLLDAIVEESTPVLQAFDDGSGLAFEISTNLAVARPEAGTA